MRGGGSTIRPVVLLVTVSLDGILAEDGTPFMAFTRALGEHPAARDEFLLASLRGAGLQVMGRVTYERLAQHFQAAAGEAGDAEADLLNRIPKAVFSRTLGRTPWGAPAILRGAPAAVLDGLRRHGSGDILVHGGARLAQSLAGLNAVDEYRLLVYPFVAGSGCRLLANGTGLVPLAMVRSQTFSHGVAGLVYRRDRNAEEGQP